MEKRLAVYNSDSVACIIIKDDGGSCDVLKGCKVRVNKSKHVNIEEGFHSDFASIPKILSVVGFPKRDPRWDCSGIIHDYLYGKGHKQGVTRAQADRLFFKECIYHECSYLRAGLMYIALRLFASKAYNSD